MAEERSVENSGNVVMLDPLVDESGPDGVEHDNRVVAVVRNCVDHSVLIGVVQLRPISTFPGEGIQENQADVRAAGVVLI